MNWISVKESLPEKTMPVLVLFRANGKYCPYVSLFVCGGQNVTPEWVGIDGRLVTHWMPIPEYPKD